MGIAARDVVPLSQAQANFSELAEEVKAGAEKIITKNGESYIALIDAQRLDDVVAGRVKVARAAIQTLKHRRVA